MTPSVTFFVRLLRMKRLCASMLSVKVHGLEIGNRYKTHTLHWV